MPGKTTEFENVFDLGDGKFLIRWDFYNKDGVRRQRKGTVTAKTAKDAKDILDDIKHDIRHGEYIDKSSLTVGEQVLEWFDYHQHELGVKERARYADSIRLHIVPELGHILLYNFSVGDIQDFYKRKRTGGRKDGKPGGLSTGCLHRFHTILNQAMDDAVVKGRIKENPIKKIKKAPKGAQPGEQISPLSEEQVLIFLEHAKKDDHYALWHTFLGTGCRPEELYALKRARLDLKNRTVTITEVVVCINGKMFPQSIPKTDRSRRTIKFSEDVAQVLEAQLAKVDAWKKEAGPLFKDRGLVFPSETGGYLNPSNLRGRHFKCILVAARLPNIRIYDLRHTHATLFFRSCKDIKLVSERLGHSDVAITLRTYYHLLPRTEDEAVAAFGSVLAGGSRVGACVQNCVADNVIAFPTAGLTKKKPRKRLRG